jgi:ribosomal protein S17E
VLFYIATATPSSCNDGSSGNALSFHADGANYGADQFENEQDKWDLIPDDEKYMWEEESKDKKVQHQNPFPVIKQEEKEIKEKAARRRPVLRQIQGGDKSPFNNVRKDAIIDKTKLLNGKPIINAGKIQFVELDAKMREQCLKNYFFCSVSCADDFALTCSADAKIFSTFVTREQHATICVRPRTQEVNRNRKSTHAQKNKERQECVLRPCSCKSYEKIFIETYGKSEFDRALKILQGMCSSWCKTGKKPAGVIDGNQMMETIDKMKEALLEMYRKMFKWIGDFIDLGKKAVKWIGDTAKKVGNHIAGGAKKVGNHIAGGARHVGRGVVAGARHVAGGFKKFGGRIGSGAKRIGRRVGRFFRRFRRW